MDENLQSNLLADQPEIQLPQPFSQSKYINRLIENAIILEEESAKEAGRLGYMARTLVQATLPHKALKTNEFVRRNGNYTLEMMAPSSVGGLPYGSIPRVILAWITTEAVKNKSKHIYLGENLSAFLRKLGFENTGGKNGDITRVKEQLRRLLKTHIHITYTDQDGETVKSISAISQSHSLWSTNIDGSTTTWQTELILNQEFFDEIISHPVPIDLGVIQAIKNSPLAIDIYCWATYRCYSLRKDVFIPWDKLFVQFGGGYSADKSGRYAFKKAFIIQLKKVCLMYKKLNIQPEQSGLLLQKSATHISSISKELSNKTAQKIKNIHPKKENLLRLKHKKYVINKINKLIEEGNITPEEKVRFFKEFGEYLFRKRLKCSPTNLYNKETKEHLYNFVNSRWTHLLENVLNFNEFVERSQENHLDTKTP
jgi:hypothetical protein